MICPVCKNEASNLKAAIVHGTYMTERCSDCVKTYVPQSAYSAKWRRDRMREDHRADMVQRYDGDKPSKEYARLYPDRARQQFGDEFMETI